MLTIDTPVMLQDAMPTTLELAGIQKPEYVEFHSVLPLLQKTTQQGVYDAIYGAYLDFQRSISYEGYKLILYPKIAKIRLFHLQTDPYEMHDLADEETSQPIIKKLFSRLQSLQQAYDDPLDLKPMYPSLAEEKDF